MTKNQIKIIAEKSFTRKDLDIKKVKIFTARMKRKELREYLRMVKLIDYRNKVTVVVPSLEKFKRNDFYEISKRFSDKKIVYRQDPQLLVGVKIIDNDQIFDFNLKNSLEEITKSYDN